MNKKIAIIGAGGHGKVIGEIALLNNYKDIQFFDDNISKINGYPFKIISSFENLFNCIDVYEDFFVAIGENKTRYKIIQRLKKLDLNIVNLLHPKSTVSKFSSIGEGVCVMANAVINPGVSIKDGVIINTSASIDHDCIIEDFVHISPNCSLSGNVKIGNYSHIGTGTSVHPGIKIGKNVKVGIGSKIYKDIPDNKVFKN